jgi:hypothetical protein
MGALIFTAGAVGMFSFMWGRERLQREGRPRGTNAPHLVGLLLMAGAFVALVATL